MLPLLLLDTCALFTVRGYEVADGEMHVKLSGCSVEHAFHYVAWLMPSGALVRSGGPGAPVATGVDTLLLISRKSYATCRRKFPESLERRAGSEVANEFLSVKHPF
jgi:hypothetical protein